MPRILAKSAAITVLSVLVSLAAAVVLLPALGGAVGRTTYIMCVLCPIVVAFPGSAYGFLQSERLHRAHAELKRAHAELADAHARLVERASRDPMTGMLNRESFFNLVEIERRERGPGALLIIDADHFKRINDELGHLVGDKALVAISGAIRKASRLGSIIGRIGGEEFAVFVPRGTERIAHEAAEAIRREVAAIEFHAPSGARHPLTVSIGGSSGGEGATISQIMREADSRLYMAKRAGRNRVMLRDEERRAA